MFGEQAKFHQKGETPMNYVGIDYHKKYSHVTAIDEEDRVIRSKRSGFGSFSGERDGRC